MMTSWVTATLSLATSPVAFRVCDTVLRTRLTISASISLRPLRLPIIPSLTAVPALPMGLLLPGRCVLLLPSDTSCPLPSPHSQEGKWKDEGYQLQTLENSGPSI